MPLTVYFVLDADQPSLSGKHAACGWYAMPNGSLHIPAEAGQADALVFDDRNPVSGHWDALLPEAERIGAELIILDFERPVTPEAVGFVRQLAERFPTAAPAAFCAGSAAAPICCYDPVNETFSEFLARCSGLVELRPVDARIAYPFAQAQSAPDAPAFFSEVLQCFCTARSEAGRLCLALSDTPESFHRRLSLLPSHISTAIALQAEWDAFAE